ncbi:Druantia anti-phage system protein DruA [Thermodesulfobacteriota bacterium]
MTIRKKTITADDIVHIQTTVDEHWSKGRKHISRTLCHQWKWFQPNGRLKDMACREVLLTLSRKGLITLPPRLTNANNDKRNRSIPFVKIDQTLLQDKLGNLAPVELKPVRNTELEPLYNSLVQEQHYLGYRQIVGNHLKYIAFIGDRPVACIGWGSAAWSVKSRDAFIGWDKKTKENNLHFIANNTRFLILPWVSVKCLASKILALNAKTISNDWLDVYHHPLYLLETFVEQNRFQGICYKAANWIRVGQTKGTAKRGHDHLVHGNIKDVFLYPLGKGFRQKLMG